LNDSPPIPFAAALRVWTRVALLSFGGPAGQIAIMHRILVTEKGWVSEQRFLHALNYCMLLPGPEAQQLATYLGWLLHRTRGGIVAGALFILPGFLSILALSILYTTYRHSAVVGGLFLGLAPAVLAVVLQAVVRLGGKVLRNRALFGLAAAAFGAIFLLGVPFPAVVIGAGLIGWLGGQRRPDWFVLQPAGSEATTDSVAPSRGGGRRRALKVLAVCLTLWWAPQLALYLGAGPDNVFVLLGLFFSKMAVVTFGGAYAVLAYVAQQAVEAYGWMRPGEMLDGLAMAETTPGPLIQVVQFVGYLAAHRAAEAGLLGLLSPLTAGILASAWVTWVTFVPCFLWIFLGAPYVERLRGVRALSAALTGITAAVVGVMLNLMVWFALHTLFGEVTRVNWGGLRLHVPTLASLDALALFIATGAAIALFRFRAGVLPTLGAAALIGMLYGLAW
jgi:chromate transporter